jgi:LAGLIDADG endonuclease
MLETPSIRRYSFIVTPLGDDVVVSSDNPSGAVNQQERPGAEEWAVGFVDGEGCFSISVVRNTTCRSVWQVQHEFAVTQAASSRSALEYLVEVFGCGRVIENPSMGQSLRVAAPLLREAAHRPRDPSCPVLRSTPTQNREAARLREVRQCLAPDAGR